MWSLNSIKQEQNERVKEKKNKLMYLYGYMNMHVLGRRPRSRVWRVVMDGIRHTPHHRDASAHKAWAQKDTRKQKKTIKLRKVNECVSESNQKIKDNM
jgi:hypothetical protein